MLAGREGEINSIKKKYQTRICEEKPEPRRKESAVIGGGHHLLARKEEYQKKKCFIPISLQDTVGRKKGAKGEKRTYRVSSKIGEKKRRDLIRACSPRGARGERPRGNRILPPRVRKTKRREARKREDLSSVRPKVKKKKERPRTRGGGRVTAGSWQKSRSEKKRRQERDSSCRFYEARPVSKHEQNREKGGRNGGTNTRGESREKRQGEKEFFSAKGDRRGIEKEGKTSTITEKSEAVWEEKKVVLCFSRGTKKERREGKRATCGRGG